MEGGTPKQVLEWRQRNVINCLVKNNKTLQETVTFLKGAFGEEVLPYVTITQAPYSPDLSPCDFYIFNELKRPLRGIHFQSPDEMFNAVTRRLAELSEGGFRHVFRDWIERHRKCIEAGGGYFESFGLERASNQAIK